MSMNAQVATTVMYTQCVPTLWGPTPVSVSADIQVMGSPAQVNLMDIKSRGKHLNLNFIYLLNMWQSIILM